MSYWYLILEILAFILIALVAGYWLGSSIYRARYKQIANDSESGGEELRAELAKVSEELNTTRMALNGESKEREAAQQRAATLEASVVTADQRIAAAISRGEALEESLDKERQVLTEADEALRELREEHQKTLHLLSEAQQEREAVTTQIDTRQTEVEVLTRDRDTWQDDAQRSLRQVAELEAQVAEARMRAEGAEAERLALRVQLESVERRTEEMVLRSNAQTDSLAQKDARIAELEARISGAPQIDDLPALNEAGFYASRPSEVDDLKLISGVGPKLEGLLNGLGIYQFQQIALLTSGQIAWVNEQLSFKGRIERDDWLGQAAKLAKDAK